MEIERQHKIYAYTSPRVKGCTEITDVPDPKENLILEWAEPAIFNDDSVPFSAKDFCNYIIENEKGCESPNPNWLKIDPKDAKTWLYIFKEENHKAPAILAGIKEEAAAKALEDSFRRQGEGSSFSLPNSSSEAMLISYNLCRKLQAETILIVANKPDTAYSWYDAYVELKLEDNYYFVSDTDALKDKDKYPLHYTADQARHARSFPPYPNKGRIEFVSLQDVIQERYEIPPLKYKILIADKSLETFDISKLYKIFNTIQRSYTLYLSETLLEYLKRRAEEEHHEAEQESLEESAWGDPPDEFYGPDGYESREKGSDIAEQDITLAYQSRRFKSKDMFEYEGNAQAMPIESQTTKDTQETFLQKARSDESVRQNSSDKSLPSTGLNNESSQVLPVLSKDFLETLNTPEIKEINKQLEDLKDQLVFDDQHYFKITDQMEKLMYRRKALSHYDQGKVKEGIRTAEAHVSYINSEIAKLEDGLEANERKIEKLQNENQELKKRIKEYKTVVEDDRKALSELKIHIKAE